MVGEPEANPNDWGRGLVERGNAMVVNPTSLGPNPVLECADWLLGQGLS